VLGLLLSSTRSTAVASRGIIIIYELTLRAPTATILTLLVNIKCEWYKPLCRSHDPATMPSVMMDRLNRSIDCSKKAKEPGNVRRKSRNFEMVPSRLMTSPYLILLYDEWYQVPYVYPYNHSSGRAFAESVSE
jgi:hypothetical protein